MQGFWASWLVGGLLLTVAGAVLRALEILLGRMPNERTEQLWGGRAHSRECLFAVFTMGGALARGGAWYALWVAGMLAGRQVAAPSWAWVSLFLVPALLLEVIPGAIASRRPRGWEPLLKKAGDVILPALRPLYERLQPLMSSVSRRVFPWSFEPRLPPGPEEAETLLRMRAEEGALTVYEAEVLIEVFRLSSATAHHYMTPRVDVVFARDDMTNDEVRALFLEHKFVRVPVVGETPDEVVGLLDRRTLGRLPEGMRFIEALLPPSFVPESMEASELLGSFLKRRQPLAVVLDEFGGVEGVVTLEDFIEEMLGSAVPKAGSGLYIERIDEDELLAAGTARLDDLDEYLGFDVRQEGIETIGGYVVNQLGRFPQAGASVSLGPWKVTVRSMSQKRVREVTLRRVRQKTGGALQE